MIIIRTDDGIKIECDATEGRVIGGALVGYATTLRIAAETELPDDRDGYLYESRLCTEYGNHMLQNLPKQ